MNICGQKFLYFGLVRSPSFFLVMTIIYLFFFLSYIEAIGISNVFSGVCCFILVVDGFTMAL